MFILSLPRLPRCRAPVPKLLEERFLAQRIHALPEGAMLVGNEFTVRGQFLQWRPFPHDVVARDVIEYSRLKDEEGAVDPAVAMFRLLAETLHDLIAAQLNV